MDQTGHAPANGVERLESWLLQLGLQGASQDELLEGYCRRLAALGVPLMRVLVAQSAFHPRYGGVGFEWQRDGAMETAQYTRDDVLADNWQKSPFYHMLATGQTEFRLRLSREDDGRFPMITELRAMGGTDYFAAGIVLIKQAHGEFLDPDKTPEGVLISWTTDAGDGFTEAHLGLIRHSLPYLGLALKSASNRKMAQELLSVYLGQDAGKRVLSGEIERGSLQKIR